MLDIYQLCKEAVENGQTVVLLTILETKGSAPRAAGARMILFSDGSTYGTIGGGRLEHEALQEAQFVLTTGIARLHKFNLTASDVAGTDMICGGTGQIWLERFAPEDPRAISICEEVVKVLEQRRKAWLITEMSAPLAGKVSDKRLIEVLPGGSENNFYLDPALELLCKEAASNSVQAVAAQGRRFLVETIVPSDRVYIFGAGHVSQSVAPLCAAVNFRTVVLDDRPEFATPERFPGVNIKLLPEGFGDWKELTMDETSYIVILTRGHLHDRSVLARALQTNAGYIGMIGSRRKRDKIFQSLLEDGYTEEDLQRVHSPIGLDIGAETPDELAVSIVGELIQFRAKKRCEGDEFIREKEK